MSISHGLDKMHLAVVTLVGPGALQVRLSNALNNHLLHISVHEDVPEAARDEFLELFNALKGSTTKNSNPSELEAEHLAQRIVGLDEKMRGLANAHKH